MDISEVIESMLHRGTSEEDAAPDALTLIHQDHEEVSALFERALDDGVPAAQRRSAINAIVAALTLHAKMEEKIFYPALRRAGKAEERDSVLEAGEEHGVVKDLIAKIKRVQGRDETLKAKVTVLKELVQHHVEEEESTMFDEARRVMGGKLQALGEEMQRFKDRAQGTGGRRKTAARKTTAKRSTSAAGGARRKKTAKRR